MKTDNRGLSILIVLSALMVVGFIGTSLIKLSQNDNIGAVLYSSSSEARDAARSGITAASHALSADAGGNQAKLDAILFRLNAYMDLKNPKPQGVDSSICYIIGSPNTWSSLTAGSTQKFRVYIDGFDFQNSNDCRISLVSEGMSGNGGRATAVAVLDIMGLSQNATSSWNDMHAIYMEDGINMTFRSPISLNGNARLSNMTSFGGYATGSVFNGKFRSETGNGPDHSMSFEGEYLFNDNCYFGTQLNIQRTNVPATVSPIIAASGLGDSGWIKINASAGFRYGAYIDGFSSELPEFLSVSGNTYWLESASCANWTTNAIGWIDLQQQTLYQDGNFDFTIATLKNKKMKPAPLQAEVADDANIVDRSLTEEKILRTLGFTVDPCEIVLDLSLLPNINDIPKIGGSTSGGTVNLTATMMNSFATNWNGFALVKCDGNVEVIDDNITEITNKIIILVPPGSTIRPSSMTNVAGQIPNVKVVRNGAGVRKEASGHVTIINNGGTLADWGGADTYRGFLYNKSGSMTVGGAMNAGVDGLFGSIYMAKETGSVLWHAYDAATYNPSRGLTEKKDVKGTITYDPTVFEELDITVDGKPFIKKVTRGNHSLECDASENAEAGKLTAEKIDPSFLSLAL